MCGKMKVRSINELRGKSIILYHLCIPLQRLPIKKNFAHLLLFRRPFFSSSFYVQFCVRRDEDKEKSPRD